MPWRTALIAPQQPPPTPAPHTGPWITAVHRAALERRRAPIRFNDIWEHRRGEFDRLIVGTRSLYDQAGDVRLVDEADWPIRQAEYSRPWLRHVHEAGRPARGMAHARVPWRKTDLGHLNVAHPTAFFGHRAGQLAYVDVAACYWELYRPATLDMIFRPDDVLPRLALGRLEMVDVDELGPLKGARNWVIGIIRSHRTLEVHHGDARWVEKHNPYLAPGLWGFITAVLHAAAADAVTFGAVCVHTDGYIIDADRAPALVEHLRERWQLPARIKTAGRGEVWAVGAWKIGRAGSNSAAARTTTNPPHTTIRPTSPAVYKKLVAGREWMLSRSDRP